MIAEQPTRKVQKELRDAGFHPDRTKGSHTMWITADGKHQVSVPDGHRTITPGVYRKIQKVIKETNR